MQVYNPDLNMQGVIIIDNIALGPSCGMISISPKVTPRGIYHEARTMTWSCALAELNLGGAAAGIRADPNEISKTEFMRSFARKISPYVPDKFIAAPGFGIGKEEMRAFVEEIGDGQGGTGKPEEMGGIPFETGVVGLGMGVAIETCIDNAPPSTDLPSEIEDATVAIQGVRGDCCALARYLSSKGAKVVGIADEECTLYNQKGLDVSKISKLATIGSKGFLRRYKKAKVFNKDEIHHIKSDFLVLGLNIADRPQEDLIKGVKAKCIAENRCNSLTSISDQVLNKKGIMVLPDIIMMAGAPITSFAEINKFSCDRAFALIQSKVKKMTSSTIQRSTELGIPLRRVAKEVAKERILKSMEATH
jgi:glutamate dehydrogenase (NAD(P)+)